MWMSLNRWSVSNRWRMQNIKNRRQKRCKESEWLKGLLMSDEEEDWAEMGLPTEDNQWWWRCSERHLPFPAPFPSICSNRRSTQYLYLMRPLDIHKTICPRNANMAVKMINHPLSCGKWSHPLLHWSTTILKPLKWGEKYHCHYRDGLMVPLFRTRS